MQADPSLTAALRGRPRLTAGVMLLAFLNSQLLAGDILRGGSAGPRKNRADALDAATSAAAARARANAKDSLARTTRAISAVQAMQTAARAMAAGQNNLGLDPNHPGQMLPDVPDGLGVGALDPNPGAGWTGANLPTQSGTDVTIRQNQQQAVLNWNTFNIGRNTTLYFDQSAGGEQGGQWVAFNKVNDPSGRPSQILGSIRAPGQVYVINQNGIIFGATSQINVHTLVASSLPVNENLIKNGLLNNPGAEFLLSGLPTGTFTPPAPVNGKFGDVTVQAGAQLVAPSTAANVGGRIVLAAPNVTNHGTLSTPSGQTILAAGLQVGFDASTDPQLRGLRTYVGQVGDYGGTVTNHGMINVPRGSVTMTGKRVNQYGVIDSSTSVSLNGRVDLNASYNAFSNPQYNPSLADVRGQPFLYPSADSSGIVDISAGSVIRILPESDVLSRVTGTKLALFSEVNIQGAGIHFGAGSTLLAPGARVAVSAGVWNYFTSGTTVRQDFVRSQGQVFLDRGAMINVAGSVGSLAGLSQHVLKVVLRGAELADSPVQRNGKLARGPELTVDLRRAGTYGGRKWVGTPLADLTGYIGLIERAVGELTVGGGSVSLSAGESVVMQSGSIVDVSGGYLNYEGGFVQTTRLMHAGRLFEAHQATPDLIYDGVYTGQFTKSHTRWGVTKTYTVPWMTGRHYEREYVQGGDGGSLSISAPSMALDGELRGHTITGPRQRESAPQHSSLSLKFTGQKVVPNGSQAPFIDTTSPTPPLVIFNEQGRQAPADAFALDASSLPLSLRLDRKNLVYLSPGLLSEQGFGSLLVENSDGPILVPENATLETPAAGAITLSGSNIHIRGALIAPAGNITLNVYNQSPYNYRADLLALGLQPAPQANPDRGNLTLASGARISAAGLLIDDRLSSPSPVSQILGVNVTDGLGNVTVRKSYAGGSVTINTYNANLAEGGVLDVSGGVWMTALGKRNYGDGGSLTIKAGQDLSWKGILGGRLHLGSTLLGYSGAKGASLSLQAQMIQIGGAASHPNTLLLDPEFFNQGGFASFTLAGFGEYLGTTGGIDEYLPAISIAPGTRIEPVVGSLLAIPNVRGSETFGLTTIVKPVGYRTPASLTFRGILAQDDGTGTVLGRGDLVMGAGSLIKTDPLGSVAFDGQTADLLGSIFAPGGSIRVSGARQLLSRSGATSLVDVTTVHVGAGARLSTAGTAVYLADRFGRRTGYVLPGGSISVSGNIIAEAGAILDVSGASGVFDVHPAYLNLNAYLNGGLTNPPVPLTSGLTTPLYKSLGVPHRIDSNGRSITLAGGSFLFSRARLLGNAGGPTALGGTLSVSSGRPPPRVDSAINLTVAQLTSSLPFPQVTPGASLIGRTPVSAGGGVLDLMGYFGVDAFERGGFGALTLGGNVQFKGPVTINAGRYLRAGLGGIISADSEVNLTAPYVAIGRPFTAPQIAGTYQALFTSENSTSTGGAIVVLPTYGPGVLNIFAEHIDIGSLSLQGIGRSNLVASNDIRGNGWFDIAGDLRLTAGQIYPTTASPFTITAYDYRDAVGVTRPGSITVGWSGSTPEFPLSGGGMLSLYGSNITQDGVLRAPLGTINLGWDGTGTAPLLLLSRPPGVTVTPDPVNPASFIPITQNLTLAAGSITSVSAIDPRTGLGVPIPYGIVLDGSQWIDPAGLDITSIGAPQKAVNLSSANLNTQPGSVIDVRGGGELFGYEWVRGNGGSQDILASSGSYAILPGYSANFSPYGPFGTADTLNGDPGYVNTTGLLDSVTNNTGGVPFGSRVYLADSPLLPAGYYTIAQARYALFPGAMLLTPLSGDPVGTFRKTDGSYLVGGYLFENLAGGRRDPGLFQRFELASPSTFLQRAEYRLYQAGDFFPEAQERLGVPVTRTPQDAGYALIQATSSAIIQGNLLGRGASGGRGAIVDINAPGEIIIGGAGAAQRPGKLVLDSGLLTSWDAESLLIGGARSSTSATATVNVRASRITVENSGTPLSAPDIVVAARNLVSVLPGSIIQQSGGLAGPSQLLNFGDSGVAGSGDGALIRVSDDPAAQIVRRAFSAPSVTGSQLLIADDTLLSGASLILDSTARSSIDPGATLKADYFTFTSGQISLQMNQATVVPATPYLVLGRGTLDQLQRSLSLNLTSYSSIDLYGAGTYAAQGLLNLTAGEIRGFANGGGTVAFTGDSIVSNNAIGSGVPGAGAVIPGSVLRFDARHITLGTGALAVDQFSQVQMNASNGLLMTGAGSLSAQSNLVANVPGIFATQSATHALRAGGTLDILPTGDVSTLASGLGAKVTVEGASVHIGSSIFLPSGIIEATALTGNLTVGGVLNADGTAKTFFDVIRYTDAGQVTLTSLTGSVTLLPGSSVSVSANAGGGDAGAVAVNAPGGVFTLDGALAGLPGSGGTGGSFRLDAGSIASFTALNAALNNGAFNETRNIRARTGSFVISNEVIARNFTLSADLGSITVSNTINAAGATGGSINLVANGSITLTSAALLTVRGADFDSAGKGGSVSLEVGSSINGAPNLAALLDIQTGSVIDLSVDTNNTAPEYTQQYGKYTGTLHLRAPQTAAGTEVTQINPINGTIIGVSHIAVEGYKIYTPAGGIIQNSGTLNANGTFTPLASSLLGQIVTNGNLFGGNSVAITNRLLAGNANAATLNPLLVVMPGAEIINTAGNLQLGRSATSPVIDDWNLATLRFGPRNAPGVLTMRASGDLILYNALSDGFDVTQSVTTRQDTDQTVNQVERLWTAPLLAQDISANAAPVNAQSWTFRLSAGADLTAADHRQVLPINTSNPVAGSVLIGKNAGQAIPATASGTTSPGLNAVTRLAINPTNATNAATASNRFQVIRTGSGDITVSARGDVQFLNQFATIYTAGVQVRRDGSGNSMIFTAGDFVDPSLYGLGYPDYNSLTGGNPSGSLLGAGQQRFPAQYSRAGGNVLVQAQRDIIHLTRDTLNNLIADSSRQLPNNWLYRRDMVDASGNFAPVSVSGFFTDPSASLTWWVDFSNFFDGVGALGGGDVTLLAGRDVSNVSAHTPTNARATGGYAGTARILELGGGDVLVRAGRDIDAGVYYVERGAGSLIAGGSVKTNSTRSPTTGRLTSANNLASELSWLPTTLFVGKSSFDATSRGDLLLGPAANPFFLPQGIGNRYWYKTYFNTFSPDTSVTAGSLSGDVTLRTEGNNANTNAIPILQNWLEMQRASANSSGGFYQPWIRLAESQVTPFSTLVTVGAPVLRVNAFSGDVNLQGNMHLFPSPTGTLELLAAGSVNAVTPIGTSASLINGIRPQIWTAASYNLSDASPTSLPAIRTPYAYNVANPNLTGLTSSNNDLRRTDTQTGLFVTLNRVFAESGATNQATLTKQALHSPGPLHAGDASPVRVYALGGDVSGLTLFSGKESQLFARRDITDVSLYLQNTDVADFSIVAAGRDIVPYNPNSLLRTQAQSAGNLLMPSTRGTAALGDIQIGGPGVLEVFAGRDLRLGAGTPNANGTAAGIVSIGNARNPYLAFDGADLLLGAGIGLAAGLSGADSMDFDSFIARYITGADGDAYLAALGSEVTSAEFDSLPEEERRRLTLDVFFLILRDAGRSQTAGGATTGATGATGYALGTEAISVLFPDSGDGEGDIITETRDIRTKSGGAITMLIPNGGLTLQQTATSGAGSSLVPPGVVTESGGGINIFADASVRLGISRIFTLRGGDITIWSSTGDINAGSSSKTVQSAPPTRVIIDPTSADVQTDLSGLATGGGIGVLATVAGVPPGNVDLIAPLGTVDAGDAGIRATGNLNIAATAVLNASNIAVGGSSAGTPSAPVVAAPNIGGLASASATAGAASSAASEAAQAPAAATTPMTEELPSIISVEVLGYGGGGPGFDDEEEEKKRRAKATSF